MAYIEPKTDWEPSDYITPADYNRIKNNLVYINDIFNELYTEYDFDPGEDIGIDEWFKASKWNMFEDCVENFQRSGRIYTFGQRSYYTDNGHLPNFNQLNRLEKCIEAYAATDIPVSGISISPIVLAIAPGESETVNVSIQPSNAHDKEISVSGLPSGLTATFNEDYSVITLTADAGMSGNVYDLSVVTHDGGYTASLTVKIYIAVTDFTITPITIVPNNTTEDVLIPITLTPSDSKYCANVNISEAIDPGASIYNDNYDFYYKQSYISYIYTNGVKLRVTSGVTKNAYFYRQPSKPINIFSQTGTLALVGQQVTVTVNVGNIFFATDDDYTFVSSNPSVVAITNVSHTANESYYYLTLKALASGNAKLVGTWNTYNYSTDLREYTIS